MLPGVDEAAQSMAERTAERAAERTGEELWLGGRVGGGIRDADETHGA